MNSYHTFVIFFFQKRHFSRNIFTLDNGETKFVSIQSLVEFYHLNKGILPCCLTDYPLLWDGTKDITRNDMIPYNYPTYCTCYDKNVPETQSLHPEDESKCILYCYITTVISCIFLDDYFWNIFRLSNVLYIYQKSPTASINLPPNVLKSFANIFYRHHYT